MGREVEIAGQVLLIDEHISLADEVGATVWDCALVLAHYLEHSRARDLQGKRVIELGAGTGLVGIAAAILGSEVSLTDRKHLLLGLEHNVELNKLHKKVKVVELEWGEAILSPSFDFIVLSDCFYDRESSVKLLATIAALSGTNTEILLAHELRSTSPECFEEIRKHGFSWTAVPEEETHPDWRCEDIRVYRLIPAPV